MLQLLEDLKGLICFNHKYKDAHLLTNGIHIWLFDTNLFIQYTLVVKGKIFATLAVANFKNNRIACKSRANIHTNKQIFVNE